LETFRSGGGGGGGYADADGLVVFYRDTTRRHTGSTEFDLDGLTELPRVDIALAYTGADGLVIDALVRAGVPGIVAAGLGSGGSPPSFMAALKEAQSRGLVVVIATQVGSGRVTLTRRFQEGGYVVAGNLAPNKARILLMLALTRTTDPAEVQRMMLEY